ncbi:MAG: hypothetical protein LBU47_01665, partial [Christensenellaceae bacterium]|nr:hypothetical protein [Christensenellaceae bacterium]
MTKISIQDAAKQLGSGAEALMEGIAATRKSAQEAILRLRQIEEGLRAQEQAALEERQKAREEEERLAAENAQERAIKAALLGVRGFDEGEEQPSPEGGAVQADAAQADPQVFEPEAPAVRAEHQPTSETAAASQPVRPAAPPRPQRPGVYAPRPFIPNPNDPNALVNRQKAGQPPIDPRAPRAAAPGAPRPMGGSTRAAPAPQVEAPENRAPVRQPSAFWKIRLHGNGESLVPSVGSMLPATASEGPEPSAHRRTSPESAGDL